MGEGLLRLSEKEAMAHIKARMVTAKVRRALALYPNECIFLFGRRNFLGFWRGVLAVVGLSIDYRTMSMPSPLESRVFLL